MSVDRHRLSFRRRPRAIAVVAAIGLLAVIVARADAQCPSPPGDAFAFLPVSSAQPCPVPPVVRWPDARVVFECGFFAEQNRGIDCGVSPGGCVDACREAAEKWNLALPGGFSFVPSDAATPVEFCDPGDGRTSVGGSDSFCDGTAFPVNVLAVTLRFTASDGRQIDSDITVNQRFTFSRERFGSTLAHEFGHVLGLDHPDQCGREANVLMRSSSRFVGASACFVSAPVLDDVVGARTIYPPTSQPAVCGDADGSGAVIGADGVQALRAAAELPNHCILGNCDVDGDGEVTVADGVMILAAADGAPLGGTCGR